MSTQTPESAGPRRVVVLGTGTGVGKTWVSLQLTRAFRALGQSVVALKPIESGVNPRASEPSDAQLLARASSYQPAEPPYQLSEPLSPHLAARRSSTTVDLSATLTYVRSHTSSTDGAALDWVLVESAGALLSPLAPGITNWDLARYLEPATWVLVAPDALGVLHDLSATLEVLHARGRDPDHVVLSAARPPDASTGTNAAELELLGIATPSASFGRDGLADFESFARRLLTQR